MRSAAFALALVLSAPALADDQPPGRCEALATLAANVAKHRDAHIPQADVASQLRAKYQSKTPAQRNANAMTERVVEVSYKSDQTPARLYREVKARCEAGEFDRKEKP